MPLENRLNKLDYYNTVEGVLQFTVKELEDPTVAKRLFGGQPNSPNNDRAMEAIHYRQFVEHIRSSQTNTKLTYWIAAATVVSTLATIVNVYIAFVGAGPK